MTDRTADVPPAPDGVPADRPARAARRPSARLAVARAAGLAVGAVSRALHRGGGTAVSGVVAGLIEPRIRSRVFLSTGMRVLAVSGSNGKTTTAALAAGALRGAGRRVAHNQAGSNMIQGISALAAASLDRLGRTATDVVVAEIDEGALLEIEAELEPAVLVVTNVVRDQLDRYGELYATAGALGRAGERLDPSSTLVLCADDPLASQLAPGHARRTFVGLELAESRDRITSAADSIRCPACRAPLDYRAVYLGHLGDWRCPSCGLARPALDVAVTRVAPDPAGTTVAIRLGDGRTMEARIPQLGLHVAYDAAFALAAVTALGLEPAAALEAMTRVGPSWGRLARFEARGRSVLLAFAKNPMAYRTVIAVLESMTEPVDLLVVHSSSIVDGEDFGWLWDVEYERLERRARVATVAGDRSGELANRLAYAGWPASRVTVETDPVAALDGALERTPAGGTLVVVSGHGPLRQLVDVAGRRGWTRPFWAT